MLDVYERFSSKTRLGNCVTIFSPPLTQTHQEEAPKTLTVPLVHSHGCYFNPFAHNSQPYNYSSDTIYF